MIVWENNVPGLSLNRRQNKTRLHMKAPSIRLDKQAADMPVAATMTNLIGRCQSNERARNVNNPTQQFPTSIVRHRLGPKAEVASDDEAKLTYEH